MENSQKYMNFNVKITKKVGKRVRRIRLRAKIRHILANIYV